MAKTKNKRICPLLKKQKLTAPAISAPRGIPFSVGLDDLENKLKSHGIRAETHPHESWQRIYNKIRKRGVREVAFVGHSMGALSAISLTKKIRRFRHPGGLSGID